MLKESISGQDVIKAIQKEIWNLPVEPEIKEVNKTIDKAMARMNVLRNEDSGVEDNVFIILKAF